MELLNEGKMMMTDISNRVQSVKSKLENMINNLQLVDAKKYLQQLKEILPIDHDIISFEIVIDILEGNLSKAEELAMNAIQENPFSKDIIFNLGYIKELNNEYQEAYDLYMDCYNLSNEKNDNIVQALTRIKKIETNLKEIKKIVFFCKQGLDSFLDDIIEGLSSEYQTKKIIVTNLEQIDVGMKWADICWFEWCDELLVYGSSKTKENNKRIICRLHRYEVFTDFPLKVNWRNVDKLLLVANHLQDLLEEKVPNIEDFVSISVLKNGVDLNKFTLKERKPGYNIAYVGYIHLRKNPVLLLQIMNELVSIDKNYKLYVAGKFQDSLVEMYWNYQIKSMGLENNIIFQEWQSDIDQWLEDKHYLLSTSIHESFGYGIAEGMARGVKPVIHNFPFSEEIWDEKYLFSTITGAIQQINNEAYSSKEYRKYIEENYSFNKQIKELMNILKEVQKDKVFDYEKYWNLRLGQKFDIEGVGYIGLGKTYNKYLYRSRLEILSYAEKSLYNSLENKSILEIGPGIGMFTEGFHQKNPSDYIGIDISKKSVEVLSKKYKKFNFILGDITNKNLYPKDIKFDLLFGADVLLHLTDEKKYIQTIKNLSNSLKEDGFLILTDPITSTSVKSEANHVVIRELDYVKDILLNEDLELIADIPTTFFMNYPFDYSLLGYEKGKKALEVFNMINHYFTRNTEDKEKQEFFAKYLYLLDKLCLCTFNFGLSQKALIIKKKEPKNNPIDINISGIWSKEELMKELVGVINKYKTTPNFYSDSYFLNILNIIYHTFLNDSIMHDN